MFRRFQAHKGECTLYTDRMALVETAERAAGLAADLEVVVVEKAASRHRALEEAPAAVIRTGCSTRRSRLRFRRDTPMCPH